jgi:hypothetical protein
VKLDMRKIYRFEPIERLPDGGLPKGGDVYYECGSCKDIVSSVSHIKAACGCGNLSGGGGTVAIKTPDQVTPLKGKLK